ncbi:hypothetical protein MKW92_042786 [Papaver armeniacum]|nr:hypothetical protein MKW92_042786 [Papaver armeniacum]
MYPWSELPTEKDSKNLLLQGPESIAFDPLGRGPYTGLAGGRIVLWNGESWIDFAYTSQTDRAVQPTSVDAHVKNEHICGRPLGLRFDVQTGDIRWIGYITCNRGEGVPLKFTNDLDIDGEGNIYFTDSSVTYQRRNFIQLVSSGDNTGRILKYNPNTKETTVLIRNLQFPNGLTMSKDKSFLIFCEGSIGRLSRYWLQGEKARASRCLPFYMDFRIMSKLMRMENFGWLSTVAEQFQLYKQDPIPLGIGGRLHGMLVKYSPEGKFLQILEDKVKAR